MAILPYDMDEEKDDLMLVAASVCSVIALRANVLKDERRRKRNTNATPCHSDVHYFNIIVL